MASKNAPALRYLLLRYMFYLREHVPPDLFRQVTRSLTVTEAEDGFAVQWVYEGEPCERHFGRDDFKFFVRGDLPETALRRKLNPQHNIRLAREFAKQALRLEGLKDEVKKVHFFSDLIKDCAGYCLCGVMLWLFGGSQIAIVAVMIPLIFVVESWYNKGKVVASLLVIVPAACGFPFTGLICALGYALFHVLDPDRFLRGLRIASALLIAGLALLLICSSEIDPLFNWRIGGLTLLAFLSFLWRWTYGEHFRFFPLLFHIISIGIYLDGFSFPAFVVQLCAIFVNFRLYANYYILKRNLFLNAQRSSVDNP